jgi:hypothetical protein
MQATGMPFFAINTGPVRPLGKSAGYGNHIDRVLDLCWKARTRGTLDFISSYEEIDGFVLGRVPVGDTR